MAVTSHEARILYVILPKAACTSIKTMFRLLETGAARPRDDFRARLWRKIIRARAESIHQVEGYFTTKFTRLGPVPEGYQKVCVIRDPLERLHSAWKNKVGTEIFRRRGEERDVINSDLELEPSFGFFVEHLERYRLVSRPARVHTEAFSWHLGPDLRWYDRVFRMEDLGDFERFVSARAGKRLTLPRHNASGTTTRPLGLGPWHGDLLREKLREDYRLVAGYYDFDRSFERFLIRSDVRPTPSARTACGRPR